MAEEFKPFPIESFASMKINKDGYIFNGQGIIIGQMGDPYPMFYPEENFDLDDIEELIKGGYKVEGFLDFEASGKIATRKIKIQAYPDEIHEDIFCLLYHPDGVCVGLNIDGDLEPIEQQYLTDRLLELGISYIYKYGL